MEEKNVLITRDWLAIERTKLANERTFLAYFRTFIVILGTGIAVLKVEFFSELKSFGVYLIAIAPIILLIGIIRLFRVKRTIRRMYRNN
jgi:putative membrane protein